MSIQTLEPKASHNADAEQWLQTPLGQYLLAREQAYMDKTVADIFGYNALQIGLPQLDLLRANRMPLRATVDPAPGASLRADATELPITSASADLALLPHVLEFAEAPHQILREVERVLVPDGHVVIACFNPMSLWGMRHSFGKRNDFPWRGRFIHMLRLKDWLALLGFEMAGGAMGCYVPPCTSQKWIDRFKFMDAAGDRWWPFSGAVTFLHAIKRVRGMRIITPQWAQSKPRRELVAASHQSHQQEQPLVAQVLPLRRRPVRQR